VTWATILIGNLVLLTNVIVHPVRDVLNTAGVTWAACQNALASEGANSMIVSLGEDAGPLLNMAISPELPFPIELMVLELEILSLCLIALTPDMEVDVIVGLPNNAIFAKLLVTLLAIEDTVSVTGIVTILPELPIKPVTLVSGGRFVSLELILS